MKAHRGTLEVEEWRPPEEPEQRAARGVTRTFSRGFAGIAVVALHFAVIALFVLPAIHKVAHAPASLLMTATFFDAEQSPDVEPPVSIAVPLLESPIALAEPGSFDLPVIELAEVETRETSEFRPPRLKEAMRASPEEFVADAGIAVARMVRVILTVTVTEQGEAGDVSVVVASGIAELDSAAIAYARTLRWQPALVRGRESSMSIRLPVVFPATG